jgi:hypothetical protein
MNKLILSAVVFLGLIATSCKKCSECHYDGADAQVEIGEYCDDELENIENNGFYDSVLDTTYEVHCHDH